MILRVFTMKLWNAATAKAQALVIVVIIIISASVAAYLLQPPKTTGTDTIPTTTTSNPSPSASSPPLQAPVARISVNATGVKLGEDRFLLSGNDSTSSNGTITEYKWSIYGQEIGYGENLLYCFGNAGVYKLTLQVTDNRGQTNTSEVTVSVTVPQYSFADALANGYIEARFSGTGSCSGDCIELHIKRLVNFTIEVEPPEMGIELKNSGSAQDMVILELKGKDEGDGTYDPSIDIDLTSTNDTVYVFSAYCLNFHRANPGWGDTFQIQGSANADILKVFNALDDLPSSVTDISAIQTAIWVITDNVTRDELRSTFPDGLSQVENARTILNAAGIDTTSKALFS